MWLTNIMDPSKRWKLICTYNIYVICTCIHLCIILYNGEVYVCVFVYLREYYVKFFSLPVSFLYFVFLFSMFFFLPSRVLFYVDAKVASFVCRQNIFTNENVLFSVRKHSKQRFWNCIKIFVLLSRLYWYIIELFLFALPKML